MGLFDIFKKKNKPVDNKYVFDKAKYHNETVEKLGLGEEQSCVHTGLFFAWLVNNDLMSDFFIKETGNEIKELKERRISPSAVYINWDGVLIGEMLSAEGFNFAKSYFDFDKGTYMSDYERAFNVTGDKVFTINDTWENYDIINPYIDSAYNRWSS